jgi:uncharacterized protein YutE (UPF0331/DUF86 family)
MNPNSTLLDAVAQKAARIQRCVARVREEYAATTDFAHDFSRQDAAILNIQRACEQAIDMANMVISHDKLGLPRSTKEVFAVLASRQLISVTLSESLQGMVGFRNVAVHEYETLDIGVVESIINQHLHDILTFAGLMLSHLQSPTSLRSLP